MKNFPVNPGMGYWYWPKEISPKDCLRLLDLSWGQWEEASVMVRSGSKGKKDVRKSDVVFINLQWVYDLIWPYMESANEDAGWKYDIVAAENPQITRYTNGGYYSWHTDSIGSHNDVHTNPDEEFLFGNTRKLSMSILLNDDYEGGDFEMRGKEDKNSLKGAGTIIVFPTFQWHQVTPVTKGTRYSLVTWFVGPPFV